MYYEKEMMVWHSRFGYRKKNGSWPTAMQSSIPCRWAKAFKRALFDKIEEEYDITAAEEAYGEYQRSGKKSRPVGEFWKELDL